MDFKWIFNLFSREKEEDVVVFFEGDEFFNEDGEVVVVQTHSGYVILNNKIFKYISKASKCNTLFMRGRDKLYLHISNEVFTYKGKVYIKKV